MSEANNIPKETNRIVKNNYDDQESSEPSSSSINKRSLDFDLSEIEFETTEEITFGNDSMQDDEIQSSKGNTTLGDIRGGMKLISGKLDSLKNEFSEKLKYDQRKNDIIDNLHNELQEYKNETYRKHFQTMIMDVIKVIDDIRKLSKFYRSQEASYRDPEKLLKLIESIPEDLEDSFYWQGVKPYVSDSDRFDPTRQKVLKKIETADKNKDKMIAERLFPGYEWDNRVIRPEMVNVYLYVKDSQDVNIRSTDE